jgi:hypothetical protein
VNLVIKSERGLDLGKIFYEVYPLVMTRFIYNGVKEEIWPQGQA